MFIVFAQVGDSLFVDLPRVRLDGGARAFRHRWGYELSPPSTLAEVEECDEGEGETVSLREEPIHIPSSVSPLGKSQNSIRVICQPGASLVLVSVLNVFIAIFAED